MSNNARRVLEHVAVVHVRPSSVRPDGRVLRGHPAGTVAVSTEPDEWGLYHVGYAVRNRADRWDGKLGRAIAVGRLARNVERFRGGYDPADGPLGAGAEFRRTRLVVAGLRHLRAAYPRVLSRNFLAALDDTIRRMEVALDLVVFRRLDRETPIPGEPEEALAP